MSKIIIQKTKYMMCPWCFTNRRFELARKQFCCGDSILLIYKCELCGTETKEIIPVNLSLNHFLNKTNEYDY